MTTKAEKTILITGGHITPAIATIEAIRTSQPRWHVVFVGRETPFEGSAVASEERHLIESLDIPFFPITAGRLKREGGLRAVTSLAKVPIGMWQALAVIRKTRPDMILSFGGYVALPVALMAKLMRIPVVTHEQTTVPGLANRLIATVASVVCTSFSGSDKSYKHTRVVHTGLPMRARTFIPPKHSRFALDNSVPLIFITGGSTGAKSVNEIVYAALPTLLSKVAIIHQVGRLSIGEAQRIKIPERFKSRYVPVPYLSADEYSWVIHQATLICGRSGANTVTEVAAMGRVALWIPLPWSAGNEQLKNAQLLEKAGTSVILPQSALTPESLENAIDRMISHISTYKSEALKYSRSVPRNGAQKLVEVLTSVS
jgi:UDP-N-acetylglucosamine--N-acetylmuramyl-(pentapeptide) pyrophosphoryl-undecaprenol N-acetylglucosamine transferase